MKVIIVDHAPRLPIYIRRGDYTLIFDHYHYWGDPESFKARIEAYLKYLSI